MGASKAMDTLRGHFDPAGYSEDLPDFDYGEEDGTPEPPPSPIGQDERRMQVRAYNHWAGLLGDRNFPSIDDLEPGKLTDFGPYSVLLDFSDGIEDPAVRFVGAALASECDTDDGIGRLSDVPARSLLSRITDHYMQILANQAPIGFEAEFVNQREIAILYRGILLPYSSDNETIDFIFGVINWKELADQQTTDELMLEIDQALEGVEENLDEDEPGNVLDLSSFNAEPGDTGSLDTAPIEERMPRPSFGSLLTPEGFDDEDEDEDNYLPEGWSLSDPTAETDGEYADDSADVYDDDYDPVTQEDEDGGAELGLSRLIEDEFERAERSERKPIDLGALGMSDAGIDPEESSANAHDIAHEEFFGSDEGSLEDGAAIPEEYEPETQDSEAGFGTDIGAGLAEDLSDEFEGSPGSGETGTEASNTDSGEAPFEASPQSLPDFDAEAAGEPASFAETDGSEEQGLYDCLADARELAQEARTSEDRSRTTLYAAVGRAYDFSLAANEAPQDYAELLEENGLIVQDRAPMTPVVKLVFGADYDKTRITEYAAVLSYAHRTGIAQGNLARYLAEADGGLKGVVNAERRQRREVAGKPVNEEETVRASLAGKLRRIEGGDLADIAVKGEEFALVMIRRTADGDILVLGEIDDDIALIERAARKIVSR